jgi:hypothetical protein
MPERQHQDTHRRPNAVAHLPILRANLGLPHPPEGENMTPKKKLAELVETIQDTVTLLETLQLQAKTPQGINYTTIRQLDWHLGWHNQIYVTEILDDHRHDPQALYFAAKILRQILQEPAPLTL